MEGLRLDYTVKIYWATWSKLLNSRQSTYMDVIDHQNCGGDWMADFFHVFSNSLAMGQDPHTRDCDVQYIWFTICVDLVLISGSHEFPWKFYCSCILDPTWSHAKAHDISAKWAAWHPIAIIHPELLVNKVHGAQAKQSQVPGFSDQFSEAVDIWTFRLYKLSKFNWYLSRRLLELLFWVGKGSQQRTTMICEQEDIYIYTHMTQKTRRESSRIESWSSL